MNPHTGRDFVQFGKTESVLNKGAEKIAPLFNPPPVLSPATARAYSDILLVQYPDCLRLVVFPEPSQELTAADQVPAYGDQLPLVLVA